VQVGSIFEFANRNAIFGALPPSSPFYAPILLTFALTGLPSAGACASGPCKPALLGCSRRTALQARGTRAQGTCSSRQSIRQTKRRNAKTRRTVSRQLAEQDSLQGQDAVKRVHTLSHCQLHLPTRWHRMCQWQAAARGHVCCKGHAKALLQGSKVSIFSKSPQGPLSPRRVLRVHAGPLHQGAQAPLLSLLFADLSCEEARSGSELAAHRGRQRQGPAGQGRACRPSRRGRPHDDVQGDDTAFAKVRRQHLCAPPSLSAGVQVHIHGLAGLQHALRCACGAAPSNKSLLSRNLPPIISFRSAAELGCSLRSGPSARLSTAPLSARPAASENKRLGVGARQRRHAAQANENVL
jgi:hypothetical protein